MNSFLGHCYASRADEQVHLVAAVFCADRNDYETMVAEALRAQGYQFYWTDDVLPALSWVARYPAAGGAVLARSVNEEQRVALGPMTVQAGSDDATAQDQSWLQIEEIGLITPLDAQFGVYPKKNVPDALYEALFGQLDPTEAERTEFGDDTPPLATYAVLDAAKMPYLLTSLLESSDLQYRSLFQGEAQYELAEHAPYLVELTEDSDFTRRLFTGPEGLCGLWERELGIFLRSRTGFEALRKHLRKFTKVQGEDGKWFYFRFWEGAYLRGFCENLDHQMASNMLSINGSPIRILATLRRNSYILCLKSLAEARPFVLSGVLLQDLRQARGEAFLCETLTWMKSHYADLPADDEIMASFRRELPYLESLAIRSAYAMRYALTGFVLLGARYEPFDEQMRKTLEQIDRDDAKRAEDFLRMVQTQIRSNI
ncbi:DUF4123 domain-containing protein [Nitrincola iocasae]|uniref:DUF4123 domain-containing protein n=1 Tax=Nitrincola iocasae TaxID=2614693 RepID=A0A5J6LBF3_9GAMM|nr:DUF4123 domain-containing protein [Nitrincola iocasae]QEW06024.1 DUF4123 domain-containing protein [Nitrincola iocasae]